MSGSESVRNPENGWVLFKIIELLLELLAMLQFLLDNICHIHLYLMKETRCLTIVK